MPDMPQPALPAETEGSKIDMLSKTEEIFRHPGLSAPKLPEEVVEALHTVDELIANHEASYSQQKEVIRMLEERIAECNAKLRAAKTLDNTDEELTLFLYTLGVERSRRIMAHNEEALKELRVAKQTILPLMGIGVGGYLISTRCSLR